jgi:uncharacterized membrane protein
MLMNLDSLSISGWEALLLVLSCVLFWGAIIGVVRAVLHDPFSCPSLKPCSPEEALLFRKFADGEIGDDEYRHHREALRSHGKVTG